MGSGHSARPLTPTHIRHAYIRPITCFPFGRGQGGSPVTVLSQPLLPHHSPHMPGCHLLPIRVLVLWEDTFRVREVGEHVQVLGHCAWGVANTSACMVVQSGNT